MNRNSVPSLIIGSMYLFIPIYLIYDFKKGNLASISNDLHAIRILVGIIAALFSTNMILRGFELLFRQK